MTKAAGARSEKKKRAGGTVVADREGVRTASTPSVNQISPARKIMMAATGWAGEDLEEIISVVAETRSRSRF
jgi:hypothetical protein